MSYSSITLRQIQKLFGVRLAPQQSLFDDVAPRPISDLLKATLADNVDLAVFIRTEKARSELIIAPVLVELRKQADKKISLFSGTEFNVDESRGLNGRCDFLISRSQYQMLIESPVVMAVEAKHDDFDGSAVQCAAEMIAARIFNEQEGNPTETIYGVVTNGQLWQFMRLKENTAEIDLNFYELNEIEKIIGILWAMTFDEIPV